MKNPKLQYIRKIKAPCKLGVWGEKQVMFFREPTSIRVYEQASI